MSIRFPAFVARCALSITIGATILLCNTASAQQPTVPTKRLGVDSIRLQGSDSQSNPNYAGKRLLGFIIARDQQASIQLAVGRQWLQTTFPQLAESKQTRERKLREEAKRVLVERIGQWMQHRKEDGPLLAYLEDQLSTLKTEKEEPAPKFFVFSLAKDQVKSVTMASPENRHVAGIAFQNDLENVTNRSAVSLRKELESRGVDVKKSQVDLSRELPADVEPLDRWRVRQALVEYSYRLPLEYQGTGDKFYKSGSDTNPMQVANDLLGAGSGSIAQLGAELGLPEFKQLAGSQKSWWKDTCKSAEADGFRGVLIKRLETKPLSARASVSVHFFALLKPGQWTEVFRHSKSCNLADVTEEQLQRLRQDPQVQNIEKLTKSLGLSLDGKLDQAFRMGAATQTALSWASASFEHFLSKHLDRLDKPTIILSSSAR